MTTEAKKWLFDVREACGAINSFVAGKSLADYRASELLRAGTERKFEIVGEAMCKLRDRAPDVFAQIAETGAMSDFGTV